MYHTVILSKEWSYRGNVDMAYPMWSYLSILENQFWVSFYPFQFQLTIKKEENGNQLPFMDANREIFRS